MLLQKFWDRVKQRFLPIVTYDDTNGTKTHTWFGHTKVYDFEGFLISDTYQDKYGSTIKNVFYPGTKKRGLFKSSILTEQVFKNGELTDQVWYDLKDNMQAYYTRTAPNKVFMLDNTFIHTPPENLPHYLENAMMLRTVDKDVFDSKITALMQMVSGRSTIVNYDLLDMKQLINTNLIDLNNRTEAFRPIQTQATSPVNESQQQVEPTLTVTSKETPTPVKPKLTPEQRKDRWEEQLLKRMEKHDVLLAQKAKVEASKHMNPEKKAQRLASIQTRLMQNEKAQHILNTRLRAFQMAQDRAILKEFKIEERSEYKQWQAEIKQANAEIKSGSLTADQIAKRKAELKEMRTFKKQAFTDYRMATKGAKRTVTESKLKSTRRQKAIFDLNIIVREKMALETSLDTELDIFKRAEMSDRIAALNAQKRALLRAFKASVSKKKNLVSTTHVADLKLPRQPLLPAFQAKDSKEAS